MGFKRMENSLGFADLALATSLKHNRSLKLMNTLNDAINWDRVEPILMAHYTVGTSGEGADAYPPLLLFKCMLLQKGFRINSDPFGSLSVDPRPIIPLSPASDPVCPKMQWIKSTPKSCASSKPRG